MVTAAIRNESVGVGGGWTHVAGAGGSSECTSYCGGTCAATATVIIHDNVKRWLTKCGTGCDKYDDCWGVGAPRDMSGFLTMGPYHECPADTVTRAEAGCGSPVGDDECWCNAYYSYWTCGGCN